MNTEQVCVIDPVKGALIVTIRAGAPSARLALQNAGSVLYVTYTRTDERDAEGRPIYR